MEKYTYSWIGRINIVKMPMLPKAIYTFNVIPINIPTAELEQTILKFVWNHRRLQIAKTTLKRKAQLETFQLWSSSYITKL